MMNAKKPMSATVTATMAAIRAAPKDRMNWMTSCTFALTRAHSHWARFARFMVTVWLRSRPLVRLQVILVILDPKCCLFATIAGPGQARPPCCSESILLGKRAEASVGSIIESRAAAVGAANRFKSINSISNLITRTPAQGAGVVHHD
jgi:hypothetical protein